MTFIAGRAALLVSCACLFSGQAQAACHPTFGDDLYGWVRDKVFDQSRRLATIDFAARNLNYVVLGAEDLNARIAQMTERLAQIEAQIAREEATAAGDPLRLAVQRDRSATRLLDELYTVRAELDEQARRMGALRTLPTLTEFRVQGLGNIGRATLMGSLTDLGDARQKSMAAKYSVYVGVTVDDEGNTQRVEAQPTQGDMMDAIIGGGIMQYYGESELATSIPLIIAYRWFRFGVENEICRNRVERQMKRWDKAVDMLPEKLITEAEQLELHKASYAEAVVAFDAHLKGVAEASAALDRRWREVFAYNAARQLVASKVLTSRNVALLRTRYESGTAGNIFSNITLTNLAGEIGDWNGYLARRQLRLLTACSDVDGFVLAEDQQDALAYARSAYGVFGKRPEFAPLHPNIALGEAAIGRMKSEADQLRVGLPGRVCGAASASSSQANAPTKLSFKLTDQQIPRADRNFVRAAIKRNRPLAMVKAVDALRATADTDLRFCVLWQNGGAYFCNGDGGAGTAYNGQFRGNGANPGADVLGGAGDGGYDRDARRVSDEIDRVTENVEARISSLNRRSEEVRTALPEWISSNGVQIVAQTQANTAGAAGAAAARAEFVAGHRAEVAEADRTLSDFAQLPSDAQRTGSLVQQVGATVLSLPELPAESILPDAPRLSGVSAARRAYGAEASLVLRAVVREHRKLDALQMSSPYIATARVALRGAERFAGAGSRFAQDLVTDSAAIRLLASGVRNTVELTMVYDNGTVARVRVDDLSKLPREALIARVRDMDAQEVTFTTRAEAIDAELGRSAGTYKHRALGVAQGVAISARSVFDSGDVVDGARIMRYGMAVLDVAVSLTPGIGWGRDVYEAVTGRDLFSDEALDRLGYGAAVIGAISFGFGDDALDWYHAVKRIAGAGLDTASAERIVKSAKRINLLSVNDEGIHVLERAEFRAVTNEEWNGLLETGSRYYDTVQRNVAVAMPSRFVGRGDDGIARTYNSVVGIIDPEPARDGLMRAVTVFREEADDIARVLTGEGFNQRRRYIPLGKAGN